MTILTAGGTSSATSTTLNLASAGVGWDAYVVVSCAIWGDGNYGVSTPSGWTRPAYKQVTGAGACGVYYRTFVGAATNGHVWSTTGSTLGLAWRAYWKQDGVGQTASSMEAPGASSPPSHDAGSPLTARDIWVALDAHNSGSGSPSNPSGWTLKHTVGGNVKARIWEKVSTNQTEDPGETHSNETATQAGMTAHVFHKKLGGGWGMMPLSPRLMGMRRRLIDVREGLLLPPQELVRPGLVMP